MTGENRMDAGIHERISYGRGILHNIRGGDTGLLVEVLHQIVVHHGQYTLSLLAGGISLLADPGESFGFDTPIGDAHIFCRSLIDKGIFFIFTGIYTDDNQIVVSLEGIA